MSGPMPASPARQVTEQNGGGSVGNKEESGMSLNAAKYYLLPGNQYNQEQLRNAVMLASQIVEKQQSPTGTAGEGEGGLEGSTSNSENSTSTGSVGNGTNSEESSKVVMTKTKSSSPPVYSRAQAAMIRASQQQQSQPNWVQTGLTFGRQGTGVLRPTWTTRSAGGDTNVSEEKKDEVMEVASCMHAQSVSSTALMVARNLHPSIVEENEQLNTTYRVGDLVKILHDDRFGGEMRGVFEASIYEVRGTLLTVRYTGDNKGIYDETIDVLFHCKRIRKHGVLDRSKLRVVGSMTEPPPESSGDSPISDYASMGAVESLPEDGNICGTDCTMTPALVESCLAVFGRTLPEFDRGYIPRMCRSARSRIHALVSLDEPDQALAALCHHLDPQLGFSELHFFSVDFTRQRQGLGSWLLKEWLSLLASNGVHYIITYASENAISWYEKHGFVHKRDMTLPERHIRGRVTLCTGAKLMEFNLQDHPDQRPDIGELRTKLKRLDSIVRHQKKAQQQQRRLKQFAACAEAATEVPSVSATATVDGKSGLMIQLVNEEAMLVKVNGNWYHINYCGLELHIEKGSGMSQEDSVELSDTSTEERGLTPPPFDDDGSDSGDGVHYKRGLVGAAGSPAKRRKVEESHSP